MAPLGWSRRVTIPMLLKTVQSRKIDLTQR
jgi:hypothetical protein